MSRITAKRTIRTSFFVDLLDIGLNTTIMILTGSVVLLAEALEGASDLVASALLWIGLKASKKRADKDRPFGHGKALFSWTLISALVMLIFGGGLSLYFGIDRLLHPEEIQKIWLAYGALLISICSNGYALSVSMRRLLNGQPLGQLKQLLISSTNLETKNTFILDLTGTGAAVMGMISLLLYQFAGIIHFDGIGSILMGLIIIFSSVILIWGIKDYLAGKPASPEILKQIKDVVLAENTISKITELKTMYIGSEKLLLQLDIRLSQNISVQDSEILINDLKGKIMKAVPFVSIIQVEVQT